MVEKSSEDTRQEIPLGLQEQGTTETLPRREARFEVQKEQTTTSPLQEKEGTIDQAVDTLKRAVGRKPKKTIQQVQTPRDELTMRVEKIMEEHLSEAYQSLDATKKQEFKIAGEKTAYAIRQLLKKTHVKVKKILKLLLRWLMLLPGVNRYFLEQEAKIKADKIIALKYRQDK